MNKKSTFRNLFTISALSWIILFASCNQEIKEKEYDTIKEGNISTTISTDTAILSKLIDISIHKPTETKFKYTFIDNSGGNDRLTVPGPSDSYLEAIIYFDSVTFNQLKASYFNGFYSSPGYNKEEFNYEWLNENDRSELMKTDTAYHGHTDHSFGLGPYGKLWLLHNKVLLKKPAN
ncbi:MAG: hypothetical protein QM791_13855 [Ferruginibacter sp.]